MSGGLTTSRIPVDAARRFEIAFDLIEHFLAITTGPGAEERLYLRDGMSVADFDRELHAMLGRMGLDVVILKIPYEVDVRCLRSLVCFLLVMQVDGGPPEQRCRRGALCCRPASA
jgi:hypothetical protein